MAETVIYTRQFCGFCSAAKRLLDGKGVSYVEHDATFEPALRTEMIARANGRTTFPQIFVGDTHIGGCDELHALEAEGRLDALLAS
jgi:glutaredoxin 3